VAVALLPIALLTFEFGAANIHSVTGIADAGVSRASVAGWLWYLRQIPGQIGWPVSTAALLGIGALCAGAVPLKRARGDVLFWVLWFLVGYVFFSAIDLKEVRHSLFLLLPLPLVAVLGLHTLLPRRLATVAVYAVTLATAVQTVAQRPVLYQTGYADAVAYIAKAAPRDSVVLFSGVGDGAFIFNLREREDRRDLNVLRVDKLLLRVAVRRELGVAEQAYSENEIANLIDRLGVHYVVAQPGFWNDLGIMQRFEAVLQSSHCTEVARIPLHANYGPTGRVLVVYRNLGAVTAGPIDVQLDLPIVDRVIESTLGTKEQAAR